MSTDKTLADVQPGGMVRLGDQLVLAKLVGAAGLMLAEIDTCGHEVDPAYRHTLYEAWEEGKAALSAQPSPGGQDAPERCVECRHTTFEVHPDGHICVHCKLIVAARQPVGVPAIWVSPGQLAAHKDRVPGDGGAYLPARLTRDGQFTKPLYAAPAQAVDLERFRPAVMTALGLSSPYGLERETLNELLDLIDSQAVGNG